MKKADIKIGSVYRAKVSDKLTDVRIDAERPASGGGGWDATNLATRKKVRIKSAQRLRAPAMTGPDAKAVAAADQENARVRDERKANPDGQSASERAMAKAPKTTKAPRATTAATDAKGKAKAATGAKKTKAATGANERKRGAATASNGTKKRTGILELAVQILAKAKEPMGCKDIVEHAIAQKLWSTGGKTPSATLYAAVIREISKKGKEARFEKVDRGTFTLRKGA
jgi:hypothetical protein